MISTQTRTYKVSSISVFSLYLLVFIPLSLKSPLFWIKSVSEKDHVLAYFKSCYCVFNINLFTLEWICINWENTKTRNELWSLKLSRSCLRNSSLRVLMDFSYQWLYQCQILLCNVVLALQRYLLDSFLAYTLRICRFGFGWENAYSKRDYCVIRERRGITQGGRAMMY